jgi:hypothetical protein
MQPASLDRRSNCQIRVTRARDWCHSVVTRWCRVRKRSIFPEIRGGKAHADRECDSEYYVEREHLRRCQYVRCVSAENSSGEHDVDNHRRRCNKKGESREPQSTHSARESCEKQPPPETQRAEREQTNDGHYYMKTPDAVCLVTKKETRNGVEGARGHALLDTETEERTGGCGRGECPRQNALRERALLEVTGAHATKETMRRSALKPHVRPLRIGQP